MGEKGRVLFTRRLAPERLTLFHEDKKDPRGKGYLSCIICGTP